MRRLRAFLKRHDNLFTFIAASFALLLFAIKDGKRDDLHDLLQRIESARGLATIRSSTSTLQAIGSVLLERTAPQIEGQKVSPKNNDLRLELQQKAMEVGRRYGQTMPILEIARDLAQATGNKEQLASIDRTLGRTRGSLASATKIQITTNGKTNATRKDLQGAVASLDALGRYDVDLSVSGAELAYQTFEYATSFKAETEKEYTRYDFFTKCGFSVCWLVGLVGKLAGIGSGGDLL